MHHLLHVLIRFSDGLWCALDRFRGGFHPSKWSSDKEGIGLTGGCDEHEEEPIHRRTHGEDLRGTSYDNTNRLRSRTLSEALEHSGTFPMDTRAAATAPVSEEF